MLRPGVQRVPVSSWPARVGALATVCSVVLVLTASPANASGEDQPHHGQGDTRIAWSQSVDVDGTAARIVIADAAGRGVRGLTQPGAGVHDIDPAISPDGRWVAFERDHEDGSADIGLVRADGRDEHVVDLGCTEPCADDLGPTWSPDGKRLLFTRVVGPFDAPNESAASAVLWTSDLEGKHVRRVSEPGIDGVFEDYRATFAPAGYVVFVRVRDADGHSAVFRMSAAGGDVRQLTPWELDADLPDASPATSGPSEDLVVFETFGHGPPEGTSSAVATVPADCRSDQDCAEHVRLLTPDDAAPVQNFNPNWSPDGRSIAFVRFQPFPDAPALGDIWRMRWDGSRQRAVATSPLFDFRPNWGVAADDGEGRTAEQGS